MERTTLERDFEIQGVSHQISIQRPWSSQEQALKGSSHAPEYRDQSSPDASPVQLCDAVDRSPPGSSVHGILQARTLEWVAMPSSRGSFQRSDQTCVSLCLPYARQVTSVVSDSCSPWTVARQAPLSMGFSRQESWTGLPFHSPGGLPNPGMEPGSPALQADSLLPEQ